MDKLFTAEDRIAPFEIRRNDQLGRYLVAAKDLDPLTLVIEEGPTVCGPADDDQDLESGDIPMCLGCFCRMTYCSWSRCSKCGWPVCNSECETLPTHSENECVVFSENNVAYPPPHTWPIINKSILVLRCLLVKMRDSFTYLKVIEPLEHHTERRHEKSYCLKGDEMLLDNLRYFGFSEESDKSLIISLSGKLNINAFSSSHSFNSSQIKIAQCIFPTASLLAHSCVPNSTWRIEPSASSFLRISIKTCVPIRRGDMITIAYSSHDNTYGTLQRHISNEDVAHFVCGCLRCKDPTELGTFVSALKCPSCPENFLLPRNPLDPDSMWKCLTDGCEETQSVQKVVRRVYEFRRKYESILSTSRGQHDLLDELEHLIDSASKTDLHQNHYVLQEIRMTMVKKLVLGLDSLDRKQAESLVRHSELLLSIADILTPGFSQSRALLQFYLSQGLMQKLRLREYNPDEAEDSSNNDVIAVYKLIYSLLSRALMFFKSHYSPQSQGFVKLIEKKLQEVTKHIQ